MSQEKITELISHLMTAISNCSLYSGEHPLVDEFSEKALKVIQELCTGDTLTLTLLGDSLVFENHPLSDKAVHIQNFRKRLRRKGIEKVVIRKGLDLEELKKFVAGIASAEKVLSGAHISVGMVEVRFSAGGAEVSSLMKENISKVRESYQGVARFRRLDMVSLEDAVMGFISTLKRESNVLRIISPVKSYSEYTYVHNTNVSVLAIFQAEALGIKGESLYDIGLAGLLHDVGKMLVSRGVLDKETKLDAGEWEEIKKHPVYGAKYLATLSEIPKLAAIAAFEHHMKFDGSGYPDTKRRGKKQHIVSQMVAIADFFDALRTERPYRAAVEIGAVVEFMKEATGKDFNPLLVENFLGALKQIRAI